MKYLLLLGVVLAALVGCSSAVMDEQPTIVVPEHTPAALPTSLSIPSIQAESSLVQTGLLPDGTLETPDVTLPLQASWYDGSVRPGDPGPAIVLGHVDGGGKFGIFHRLRELKTGSEVTIDREDGSTVRFVVYRMLKVDKDKFPTDVVYGNTEEPELRLITCGGVFDRKVRSYEDNIIAFAKLTE